MDLRSFPHDSQTCRLKFGSCKYQYMIEIKTINANTATDQLKPVKIQENTYILNDEALKRDSC